MVSTSRTDACVIGAGISGLATAKCLQDAGFAVVVLEQSDRVGGLWAFRERGYGVMRFTHINISKHNYCFSDYPFPDDVPDFPHHSDMAKYIVDYMTHFGLDKIIRFQTRVVSLNRQGEEWIIKTAQVDEDKHGREKLGEQEIFVAKYVAVASGHHATPNLPNLPGQESFKGEIIHSILYKDAITSGIVGKRVLVVGIGNSAVDVAVDAAATGRYNLNPKKRFLQSQPTVSPTLIHHIQRGHIKVKPDIARIEGGTVHFVDGSSAEVDHIILCTGYHIRIPYLSNDLRSEVLDESSNSIKLFKNVFSPTIGPSLAFIGFVQPASGGILSMSETQARWFAELCSSRVKLPSQEAMRASILEDTEAVRRRYAASARHTIQRDPILYNDDLASRFGAKPQLWRHPSLAWRLLIGSCGAAQWRLNGPGKWDGAPDTVRSVPVTGLMHYGVLTVIGLVVGLLACIVLAIL